MIQLIATDMDGTLLNSRKELPEEFFSFVKAHPAIRFVIASGRQYYNLEHLFAPIQEHLIFLAENGAVVFHKQQQIFIDEIKKDHAAAALKIILQEEGIYPIVCGEHSAYMLPAPEPVMEGARQYYHRLQLVDPLLPCLEQDRILKLAFYAHNQAEEKILPQADRLPSALKAALSGKSWVDVMNRSTDKGNALKAIQRKFKIPPENCAAFGDYLNDKELLLACGIRCAMENAHPDLKGISTHTAPSNDNNGVMDMIKRFLL